MFVTQRRALFVASFIYVVFVWEDKRFRPVTYDDIDALEAVHHALRVEGGANTTFVLHHLTDPPVTQPPLVEGLFVRDGTLCVQLWSRRVVTVAKLTPDSSVIETFADTSLQRLVIVVGAGGDPGIWGALEGPENASTGFVFIEPAVEAFADLVGRFSSYPTNRIVMIPAAVAHNNSFMTLYESSDRNCDSLQPMSGAAENYYMSLYNDERRGPLRRNLPPNKLAVGYKEAATCARPTKHETRVPVMPLSTLLRHLPMALYIDFLVVDTGGYGLKVATSLGGERNVERVGNLLITCQEVLGNHPHMLTVGAQNCGDVYNCVHRVWRWALRGCWAVRTPSFEYQCWYVNPTWAAYHHTHRNNRTALKQSLVRPGSKKATGLLREAFPYTFLNTDTMFFDVRRAKC